MSEIRWFVGLDWARNQHRACVLGAEGTNLAERDVNHDGAGLADLCTWLVEITGAQPAQIAVAIETPRGPIVETLLERGFAVYSINPKQLDRFRDRFTVAGAKDDSRDAHVLADSLQICEQRDVEILRSFPGLGRINVAALLAEACQPLHQRDYQALRMLSGSAPVSRRSGKTWIVLRRHACNNRLRNAIYHWSRVAIQHDAASKQRYQALRSRGHSHARALRGVGDRLLYVLCTLLERQTPYDPDYRNSAVQLAA